MEQTFSKYLITDEISFKYAKGMRDIIGKEMHTYHEIFLFIDGDAEFISESGRIKIAPYTTVIIPKETFHQFVVLGEEWKYCRCVFSFTYVTELDELIDTKMNQIYVLQDKKIAELILLVRDMMSTDITQTEKSIFAKAILAQILVMIVRDSTFNGDTYSHFHPTTKQIISYINKNLPQQITIDILAEYLSLSPSYISHLFKRDMHISIYKYILEKRLIMANSKIKKSIPPIQAAEAVGFHDYSGFYRQYQKMFGYPPSKTKQTAKSIPNLGTNLLTHD